MQSKESKKTLTFLLVAGMALLVAWEPWRPAPANVSGSAERGQKLFPDFTDPLAAKSLEVISFDEKTSAIRDFKIAQEKGIWSIPSHSNYPADAAQHMADAATALRGLSILGVASDKQGEQEEFGVTTPDPKNLKVGMRGVGTRVTVKDGGNKVLADLVIGKQVKDQPGQFYVRRADRDQIYSVALQPQKFSTKFGDWIEKDLLKLNAFDVRDLELNDYSTQAGVSRDGRPVLQLDQRSQIDLSFDDAKSQWNLEELIEFEKGKPSEVKLAEDEELNAEKLNGLKTAIDDLQIVDVEKKPAGLSRDLAASDEFLNNVEAMQSLGERGFIPAQRSADTPREIFSSEGEATCTTKEGVRYVLRFGNLAGTSSPDESPAEEGKEAKGASPNRYLFVMAEFDESQIPKPQLDPLPGEEKPADAEEKKPAEGDKPADEKPADEKPAAGDKPAENKPAEDAADKPAPETKTSALQDDAAPAEKAAEAKPADEPPAEAAQPADAKPADPAKAATPEDEKRIAIERENKRKQDEYDTAVKKGINKVKELNDRFADWYFIISDDTYKKIHLSRADIIQKKAKPDDEKGQGINELKKFEGGLKGLPQGLPQGLPPQP